VSKENRQNGLYHNPFIIPFIPNIINFDPVII